VKHNQLIIFIAIIFAIGSFASCTPKKKGCTDSTVQNFDAEAEEDDGSCSYVQKVPQLVFKFNFDSNQERLGSFGAS
jgi:hypothetical protein